MSRRRRVDRAGASAARPTHMTDERDDLSLAPLPF
jgi:hypothetical protein